MAEALGQAVLTLAVDDRQFQAGLSRVQQQAVAVGQSLGRALGGNGGQTLTGLNIRLASLQKELQNVEIGTRRFRELRKEIEGTEKALNRASGGGRGGLISGLTAGLAGLGIGAAFGGFLKGSIDAAVELETITRRLSNTLGPQGAGQVLSFTKGLSDQLGLSFKTLAGSFGSFTAAATAANVPLEQQKALFGAVSKAAQALGLSNDEINGSLDALKQVASKGTVQMEELRGQLGERLPIAFAATAKGLGLTTQELIKLVESGKLTADQFFPALTKGLNELTAGAGGAETAAQNFQKLANAWDELQTSFGTSLLPTVTEQVKGLIGVLEGVGVVAQANKLGLGGGLIGNALGIIPEQGAQAVGALQALQQQYNLTGQQARALFTDAVKGAGGSYNAFGQLNLSAKQFEQVLGALPQLAEQFRAKNKDTTGELNAQAAAAAKLLQQSKDRVAAEQKLLDSQLVQNKAGLQMEGIESRIAAAEQLATLEGTGLVVLQNRLAIEEQLRQAKEAELELQRELAKPAGDGKNGTRSSPRVDDLLIKQRQVNAEVRQAYAQAGASLVKNAQSAADALKNAQASLESVLRGGFEYLTPRLQEEQLRRARASVQPLVDRGIIREGVDISTPDKLFAVANFADSFSKAEKDLGKAIEENTAAQKALVDKDWNVVVQVPGGTASGDVVGAVNSRL